MKKVPRKDHPVEKDTFHIISEAKNLNPKNLFTIKFLIPVIARS
jgi:hypothetical protein